MISRDLILGIILTLLPITELRAGLPLVIKYCTENELNFWPYFVLIILLNSLIIFLVFAFFDYVHHHLLSINFYRKASDIYLSKIRKKAHLLEKKLNNLGFIALSLFVAIPIPGTGAWTGAIIAWVLNLNRKKSLIAISFGVLIAGLIILGLSLGFFELFN